MKAGEIETTKAARRSLIVDDIARGIQQARD